MTTEDSTVYTLGELAKRVGGTIEGSADVSIRGVAAIEEAGDGDLTFVSNPKYRAHLAETRASAVIVADDLDCPAGLTILRAADPYAAFANLAALFDPGTRLLQRARPPGRGIAPRTRPMKIPVSR